MSEHEPKDPAANDDGAAPKPADDLKGGLLKAWGAAKRLVSEQLPNQELPKDLKELEELMHKGADAAMHAVGLDKALQNPTVQRISSTVETGAREVGRALENVTQTALESVRKAGSGTPHTETEDERPGTEERPADDEPRGPRI